MGGDLNQLDPMRLVAAVMNPAQTIEILARTKAKAELRAWALQVKLRSIDPRSSLALDDDGFMTDYVSTVT